MSWHTHTFSQTYVWMYTTHIHTHACICTDVHTSICCEWPAGTMCPLMQWWHDGSGVPSASCLNVNSVLNDGFYAWYCKSSQSPLMGRSQVSGNVTIATFANWSCQCLSNVYMSKCLNCTLFVFIFMDLCCSQSWSEKFLFTICSN